MKLSKQFFLSSKNTASDTLLSIQRINRIEHYGTMDVRTPCLNPLSNLLFNVTFTYDSPIYSQLAESSPSPSSSSSRMETGER